MREDRRRKRSWQLEVWQKKRCNKLYLSNANTYFSGGRKTLLFWFSLEMGNTTRPSKHNFPHESFKRAQNVIFAPSRQFFYPRDFLFGNMIWQNHFLTACSDSIHDDYDSNKKTTLAGNVDYVMMMMVSWDIPIWWLWRFDQEKLPGCERGWSRGRLPGG